MDRCFVVHLLRIFAAIVIAAPLMAQTDEREITATAVAHDTFQLTPNTASITRNLIVDSTSTLIFSVVAASRTLTVSMLGPNGIRYTIGDTTTSTFSSAIVPIDSTTTRPGASYVAQVLNPMSGAWSVTVSESAALSAPLDVVATAFFNNATRLVLAGGGETYPVDASVRLVLVA